MLSASLAPLGQYKQFILCKLVPKGNGKTDKIPLNPTTLTVSSAHDSTIWVDYQTAETYMKACGEGYGLGFVFTKNDPFFFLDIDDCLSSEGQWSELSIKLCNMFKGAAVEVSQSGTGLHIFGAYSGEAPPHGCKNTPLKLEFYTEGRFVALTDTQTTGQAALNCDSALPTLISEFFQQGDAGGVPDDWRETPVEEWNGPEDDDVLLQKIMSSQGASSLFGGKASFKDLWTENTEVLSNSYPSINPQDLYDRSSADAALASHLAFWTGKNHGRIQRMMQKSALVRDKWVKHKSYMKLTVSSAVNKQKDVYSSRKREVVERPITEAVITTVTGEPQFTVGHQYMSAQQQSEYFKGCVYIRNAHRVFVPDGAMLKPDQFKAEYGGYEFAVNDQKTTKNAWEAFIENQLIRFPKVTSVCFRPEQPPGEILEEEGITLLNTYVPIKTGSEPGDASRFVDFVTRLIPDPVDRDILLSYMAACVQYPGVKFQYWPIIQGTEGNGKTLLARVLSHAVGHRYTHFPNASDLAGNGFKFNAWILGNLLIVIEEIYVSDRKELTEPMKVFITNDRIEIQAKGQDQFTGDNRANGIMFSNHKDAMHISVDTRRYVVFYSAQQTYQDIVNHGMSGTYFSDLYRWLKTESGYEICNNFLQNYQITPKYNPATECQRAPQTTSTMEAVALSLGGIEQEILDAVEQGKPGFADGWVSSISLDLLLKSLKAERKIPINRRKAMMESLGYVWHPALTKGRLNNVIPAEGGKPKIYVRRDHIYWNLETPGEVHRLYVKSQNYPTGFAGNQEMN